MATQLHSINLMEIVALKKRELSEKNEDTHKLYLALQSIQHRINYCEYHYLEIENVTNKTDLLIEQISRPENNLISIRTTYEANIFAFIQSLHALIDSLPYALNIFYNVCKNIESNRISWNREKFIDKYKEYPFYNSLISMHKDKTFAKLRSLNNAAKHKHLVRIRNDYNSLYFEEFDYKHNGESQTLQNVDVKKFLAECHDHLLPKYMALWNEFLDYKKIDPTSMS